MNRKCVFWITGIFVLLSFAALALAQTSPGLTTPDMPHKMKSAIEKSLKDDRFAEKTKKVIKPGQPIGLFGVPGAPSPNLILGLLWGVWVGWIFSTVGAFGGIMAGVGHITIFGIGNYAKSFGKGSPVNTLLTDSIRVSNQWLGGMTGLISSINYYRMRRLVVPLAVSIAIGGIGGSWLVPALTAGKISLRAYIGYFGIIVFAVGAFLVYEITPRGSAKRKEAKAAAEAYQKAVREKTDTLGQGVKTLEGSWVFMWIAVSCVVASALWVNLVKAHMWVAYILVVAGWVLTFFVGKIRFTFYGQEWEFRAWLPMVGGIFIAAIASFLGVGGGFLYVPFLTSVTGLPMYLVAGTSALCVLIGMIVSIFTYMVAKGVFVAWAFIAAELIGVFVGSVVGPYTSRYIPDKYLKLVFIVFAFYVGLRYTSQGFLGYRIVP
jgi:uncharacterized membrane protein YfcA